jgi:hypothetical protein
MTFYTCRGTVGIVLIGAVLGVTGCGNVVTRANPEQVTGGGKSTVVVKLTAGTLPADPLPALAVVDGEECGTVQATAALQEEGKWASAMFTANQGVENCVVTIQASVGNRSSTSRLVVNRFDPRVRIDGISAIAAILIASFAIDRVTSGLLAFAAYLRRRKPSVLRAGTREAFDALVEDERDSRVPYFVIAGVLGAVVLGWFGQVRVLGALGFLAVNPYLDALITGLVLMIGADRASDLLKRLDVPMGDSMKKSSAPIEVTGKLVLENPEGKSNSDRMMV